MASVSRVGKKWRVRWRELRVIADGPAAEERSWAWRERRCPDKATADRLAREIEQAAALGEKWEDRREQGVATIGRIALDYVAAAIRDPQTPRATEEFRATMLGALLRWAGEDRPVTDLSVGFLRDYADSLPGEGRKAVTRHRKVQEAERLWSWSFNDPDRYPGVPVPRRVTDHRLPGAVRQPPPVVSLARPTWADLDAVIAQLRGDRAEWHARLAMILRYTGLRAGQGLSLRWEDIDLEREVLWVRAGVPGAKRGGGRAMPVHPSLVEELAGWGRRDGLLFAGPGGRPLPSARPNLPFHRGWVRSGVDPTKWASAPDPDVPGARAYARPTHAFRAAVMGGLLAAGVPLERVEYLIGHARGSTIAAYIPEGDPESVPMWEVLVADVAKIPPVEEASGGNVVVLPAPADLPEVASAAGGQRRAPRGESLYARASVAVSGTETEELA
jgi:integrase